MIQFITHTNERYDYIDGVRMALEGGCRWIQLRMKDSSEKEILKTAESTRKLCRKYGSVFILDDYVELVERTGADGVHLGKNDMPIDKARRLLGKDKIIGGTANTFEDVKRIYSAGADYMDGTVEAFRTASDYHLQQGTTTIFPTLSTSSYETIMKGIECTEVLMKDDESTVEGLHLEGPYFSVKMAGAQLPELIRPARPEE